MEKNKQNLNHKQTRILKYVRPTSSGITDILVRLSQPYPSPKTNIISCGTELAVKLQALLNL